ncbi:MAG TPA: hypothetical protein VJW76_09840 [Verrucomicrobiae bacterium]|nr:hypothetical protein [Verrucomicrobiae bacterium]
MKLIPLLLVTLAFAVSAQAASIEGVIQLKYDESAFAKDTFKKEFGDVVKATCNWRAGDFFGKETIFAGVTVKNTGNKPMFFQYYVAFFDKDKKLIGSSGQGSFGDDGLKAGQETQMGSCLIHLPKDRYKDIASYQAIIYESDVAPKKK